MCALALAAAASAQRPVSSDRALIGKAVRSVYGGKWLVALILWQEETPENPLPPQLLRGSTK
jgi:hypothetical protein